MVPGEKLKTHLCNTYQPHCATACACCLCRSRGCTQKGRCSQGDGHAGPHVCMPPCRRAAVVCDPNLCAWLSFTRPTGAHSDLPKGVDLHMRQHTGTQCVQACTPPRPCLCKNADLFCIRMPEIITTADSEHGRLQAPCTGGVDSLSPSNTHICRSVLLSPVHRCGS